MGLEPGRAIRHCGRFSYSLLLVGELGFFWRVRWHCPVLSVHHSRGVMPAIPAVKRPGLIQLWRAEHRQNPSWEDASLVPAFLSGKTHRLLPENRALDHSDSEMDHSVNIHSAEDLLNDKFYLLAAAFLPSALA